MQQVLHSPDAERGVQGPGWELFGQCPDVRPVPAAGEGGDVGAGGLEGGKGGGREEGGEVEVAGCVEGGEVGGGHCFAATGRAANQLKLICVGPRGNTKVSQEGFIASSSSINNILCMFESGTGWPVGKQLPFYRHCRPRAKGQAPMF